MSERVILIQGDLIIDKLCLSLTDREMLTNDLDIIINSAASVDFSESLQNMIKIDYFGPIRVLELAKECKKLQVLSHISTAYVGSNQPPFTDVLE